MACYAGYESVPPTAPYMGLYKMVVHFGEQLLLWKQRVRSAVRNTRINTIKFCTSLNEEVENVLLLLSTYMQARVTL